MVIVIIIIIKPNMCAGANIPFQTLCIGEVSMYLIQTSKTKTTVPEIANECASIVTVKKMLECDTGAIPNFYAKGSLIRRTIGTFALRLRKNKQEKGYGQ